MDKIVSTVIIVAVTIALAVALSTYYSSIIALFTQYEEISFDSAYATVRDGKAEIVLNFKNTGPRALTVVDLEINGVDLEPTGDNPFPLELPSGTNARLGLDAGLDTFISGMIYEVAIRTASGGIYSRTVVMP
jgi:hypothetical protein